MKILLQILFFYLLIAQISLAQWVLTNGPKDLPIYSFATDGINVYAAADTDGTVASGGCVFLSTNNGEDWSNVSNGLNCGAIESLAINDTNIFAGSVEGGVFLSTNMGANWTNVSSGLGNLFVRALLVTPNGTGGTNLYAGTMGGGIFLSTNNGINWSSVSNGLTDLGITSLAYLQNQANEVILFAGTYNGIFVSTNNGENWSKRANTQYFENVVVSGENVFAAGIWHVWFSTDLGLSWTDITTGLSNLPVWALATHGTNVFALTNWGNIFLSTNNGSEWTLINEGIIDTLVLAIGINDNYIFASGVEEGIWRRPLSEVVSSAENSSCKPINFSLEQNYPNPFNPSTKISWQSPVGSHQTIKVFDVLGNEVATLVDEYKPAGTSDISFNASNLQSGVYFYRLQAGDYVQTRKMILLK